MTTSPNSSDSDQVPPDMPPPNDQADWEKAAQDFQQSILEKTQASAAVWAAAVSTLLGLFGTVALVTGPTEFMKLNSQMRIAVVVATVIAGALAACSVVFATQAQELPDLATANWNGYAYRAFVASGAKRARTKLDQARQLGLFAAAVLFLLGLAVMITGAF